MKYETQQIENLKYLIGYPDSYVSDKKYPVIIMLHGAGGRGTDIEIVKNSPYFKNVTKLNNFGFISIVPQCSENTWFDQFSQLKKLVLKVSGEDFTDPKRIYLMGPSMGGYATWQLAMSMPEFFAAIVPICGGGMYWNAARLVNVPVWAFHGCKDGAVLPEESQKMVDAVNQNGGSAKLTYYPENGHNAWDDTFSNPEVYEWLLSHENKNTAEMIDIYNDIQIYG